MTKELGVTRSTQEIPALRRHANAVVTFVRDRASAFTGSSVAERLAANGRRTLVVAGHASEVASVHGATSVATLVTMLAPDFTRSLGTEVIACVRSLST